MLLGHYRHYRQYTPYSGDWADGRRATLVRNPSGPVADLPVAPVLAAVSARLDVPSPRAARS